MKLIIQIPCYNEAETLDVTIHDLPRHIDGIDEIEYLIINDGSTDRTVERAKELGVHHIVSFVHNRGLAKGFMAGIDACLRLGADIIVNTDADNQYAGADIEKLVRPLLEGKATMVIGNRRTDSIEHFSPLKKKLQKLGSGVVRKASGTDVVDTTSGFRSYTREAAMRLNVLSDYTYTLETIIQAGWNRIPMTSVPVRTNPELRPSRLFKSMWRYMKRSSSVILRAFAMYKPLRFFGIIGGAFFGLGVLLGLALRSFTPHLLRQAGFPLFIGLAVPVSDEFLQLFVEGRAGMVQDVALDFFGMLTGLALTVALLLLSIHRKRGNETAGEAEREDG